MEPNNSSALSYYHQFVQDNTGTMSISNEQLSSDSMLSATASTTSGYESITNVHGNTPQRKRQRQSVANETNFVPPRKKSKKYENLPDDVAELKRIKVNQLEKARQRQIKEVFQELQDLNMPQLVEPGPKKCSKSYLVRNTYCMLQYLHARRQTLHKKLQQKIQRKGIVLVGQGIIPNNGQGNISEILGQIQPPSGVEGIGHVEYIGYSDFIVASSITSVNKAMNTTGGKFMHPPLNVSLCAGSNTGQAHHQTAKGHNYHVHESSNKILNQHVQTGLCAYSNAGQIQPKTAEVNYSSCENSCYGDNLYAVSNTLARQHIGAPVNAYLFKFGNAGCSQTDKAGITNVSTFYIVPGNAGNITPAYADDIASVQSDYFLSGNPGNITPSLAGNFEPFATGNIAPVQSVSMTPDNADIIDPDTFGYILPVGAVNMKPGKAGSIAPYHNGYLDTGCNTVYYSGYNGKTEVYQ